MDAISNVNGWVLGAVLAALVMFGLAYNTLVEILGERKEGYTGFFVAIGTVITLAGAFYVTQFHPAPIWVMLACFAASGIPMIVGDVLRVDRARQAAIRRHQAEAQKAAEDL
jgi:Na+/melibiose symporter-like transporter